MSREALLLFQFGPVQGFIQQAKTLGALKAGSRLLAHLTQAAMGALPPGSRVVFPVPGGRAPNRFLAFVPAGRGAEAALAAERALQGALWRLAEETLPDWAKVEAFRRQVEVFPQITWAVEEDPSQDMGKAYRTLNERLAIRRNTREFAAWHEREEGRTKDILSGVEVALDVQAGLGAMNLVKHALAEQLPEPCGYVAVLAMDGDHMGEHLEALGTEAAHLAFSKALQDFGDRAEKCVREHGGEAIYVGGDDVLAVLPAAKAVACAVALRALFGEIVRGCRASAGIAVGHSSVPWLELVGWAHQAERRAKTQYGRNALALALYKRSGEIAEWGCNWGSAGLDLLEKLTNRQTDLGRFPYKLASLLRPYNLKGALPPGLGAVVLAETAHALSQTESSTAWANGVDWEKVLEASATSRAEDFLGLFLCAAFLLRKGEADED